MDITVMLGLRKFSLQAIIDRYGPSTYSGHYSTSINRCKKLYCKMTEFELIATKNFSIAYVVIYQLNT